MTRGVEEGSRRWKRRLALLVLSVVAGALPLGLAEVALRLAGYEAIYDVYSKPSLFWQHDALLGWSHTPDSSGVYVGPRPWPIEFETPITINSLGLRGPDLQPRQPRELRILALGDSRTAAFEVPYEQTFTALLERSLTERLRRPVRVINAGVRGYGTDQSLLYFRDRGHRLDPDVILFLSANNDPTNNMTIHRMRRPFGKAAFALGPGGALELKGYPVPRFPHCSSWIMTSDFQPRRTDGVVNRVACHLQMRVADHSALFTLAAMRIRQNPRLLQRLYRLGVPKEARKIDAPTAPFILTSRLLRELSAEATRHGAGLAVFLTADQAPKLDTAAMDAAGIRVEIVHRNLEEGIDSRSIRFLNDSHYNEAGHRLLAARMEPVALDLLLASERGEAPR
ncbi:MAG: GDSL-type esterase/lipase family protein [Myxococcota bacterium]|nr:GDSL-type esterase/lipase family protein [Myxococcota bacterium]MDP7301172.1 GDSL-type esterase/lipase family protein [Myxococcota bacterium]